MKTEPVLRRYRREDRAAVMELYERVRKTPMGDAERRLWEWQFEQNPQHPSDGLLYWVMEGEHGLVGQMATMPVRLKMDGQELPSAWGVDLMIDPSCRGRGLALQLLIHWTESLDATLGKGIADAAYHLATTRLSWRVIGPTYRHVKLLNPRRALGGEFDHPLLQRAGGIAGEVLDKVLTRRRHRGAQRIEIREPARFGPEFDALWSAISGTLAFAPIRDEIYLTWRYGRHPFHRYRALCCWRGDALTGCFVIRCTADRKERQVGQLLELLVDPSDPETFGALVGSTVQLLQREQVDYLVAMVTDRALQRRLAQHGFIRRRAPETRLIGEFGRLPVQPSRVFGAENWYITMGDADSEIL